MGKEQRVKTVKSWERKQTRPPQTADTESLAVSSGGSIQDMRTPAETEIMIKILNFLIFYALIGNWGAWRAIVLKLDPAMRTSGLVW